MDKLIAEMVESACGEVSGLIKLEGVVLPSGDVLIDFSPLLALDLTDDALSMLVATIGSSILPEGYGISEVIVG